MSIASCVSKFIMSEHSQFSLDEKIVIIEPLENGKKQDCKRIQHFIVNNFNIKKPGYVKNCFKPHHFRQNNCMLHSTKTEAAVLV